MNIQNEEPKNVKTYNKLGYRHIQVLLHFTGITVVLAIRTNLSVGIVSMTEMTENSNFEIFDWDEPTKGLILSSYYWGYVISHIPGGVVAHIFGAKYIFLMTIFASSIITASTPFLAPLGWQYICASRVLIGFTHGFSFPCVHALMAKWVHPSERGLSASVMAAAATGVFIMLIISGTIADSVLGWPGIFYISAVIGFIWSICWVLFGSESPSVHKWISENERTYLVQNVGVNTTGTIPLPWARIFTSSAFLPLFIVNIGQIWGFSVLLTETPSYLAQCLDFNIESSALLSSLPYLGMSIMSFIFSFLSDFLINRSYLSRSVTRKLFNTIGFWFPAACMCGLGFITKETAEIGVPLLVIASTFNAGANVGINVNHMDIAPNFAGTLFGLTNGVANLFSILGPIFVGFIVTDQTNAAQWNIVFLITAGFYFIGNLLFIIFGKGTIQDWNEGKIIQKKVRDTHL